MVSGCHRYFGQKYFRKAGVPEVDADGKPVLDENGKQEDWCGAFGKSWVVHHRLAGVGALGNSTAILIQPTMRRLLRRERI